jgi:hypothetical protein
MKINRNEHINRMLPATYVFSGNEKNISMSEMPEPIAKLASRKRPMRKNTLGE